MLITKETFPKAFERNESDHLTKRQKRILALKFNDEFTFSYTGPRDWTLDRYRVLNHGVVELISEHRHRESTPYPAGPQLVDPDREDRFTSLEKIAKAAVGGFTVFKEL